MSYEAEELLGEYPGLVRKLAELGFDSREIGLVLSAVSSLCRHCWDAEEGCQCWNDE